MESLEDEINAFKKFLTEYDDTIFTLAEINKTLKFDNFNDCKNYILENNLILQPHDVYKNFNADIYLLAHSEEESKTRLHEGQYQGWEYNGNLIMAAATGDFYLDSNYETWHLDPEY